MRLSQVRIVVEVVLVELALYMILNTGRDWLTCACQSVCPCSPLTSSSFAIYNQFMSIRFATCRHVRLIVPTSNSKRQLFVPY